MNQILDRSGPKKVKMQKNPEDTIKIIRVYAILIIIFGLCFIGKGVYSLQENNKILKASNSNLQDGPLIELVADQDELSINVSNDKPMESISYQWYRGMVSSDEIQKYEENRDDNTSDDTETDDDEIREDVEGIVALGDFEEIKLSNETQKTISKIGIPKGDSTIRVIVRVDANNVTEFIQSYHTDVGVDKIAPLIDVKMQGTKLIVTAVDETEISKIIYSINGEQENEVDERLDKKTIKFEIQLDKDKNNEVKINAVDKAKNTRTYSKEFELFVGTPIIEFSAEPDFSKIYVNSSYSKGITKIEYEFNGEYSVEEFNNPKAHKQSEKEFDSAIGKNTIKVKVYTEEERVYAEDVGECEYNP